METPNEQRTTQPSEKPTLRQNAVQKTLELRKTSALKEIERRIGNLESLIKKISVFKKITEEQKQVIINQINEEISKLQLLKETITGDQDLQTLQQHKKEIVNSYKIYALYLPKITILAHADNILSVADLMLTRTEDTSVKTKIEEAKSKVNSAITLIQGVTTQTTDNNSVLKQSKTLLQEARIILNSVRPKLTKPASDK